MEHLEIPVQTAVRIAIKSALFHTSPQNTRIGQYQIFATPRPGRKCLWLVGRGGKTIAHGVWEEGTKQ